MGGRVEVDAADETALDELRGAFSGDVIGSLAGGYDEHFLREEGEDRASGPGSDQYERLKAVKRSYDLTNSSRLNQNITPD